MPDIAVTITSDTASPTLRKLSAIFVQGSPALRIDLMQDLGRTCVGLSQRHVLANGTNKQNWPTTGFYKLVAQDGIDYELASDVEFVVRIDHPTKSGAMRQRYYGGDIHAKDKLLTIPAREEFYGHSPTEFTNLRFVQFASGAKAFVIGKGGVGKVDFETGTEHRVHGAGARAQCMVAYWLRDSVHQEPDNAVIPSAQDYSDAVMLRLAHHVDRALN
jgi:hypothetical protein